MNRSGWRRVPIKDLCTDIFDGPHATPSKVDRGPIFLGISNLAHGRLELSEVEHLSEQDFVKWTRRVTPESGDIVFSYETRLGEAAVIPEGLRCCLGRRMALIRVDRSKADAEFLLYAFLGPQFQEVIRSRTVHGSTVERIALIEFPDFPIDVPLLDEQRRIGQFLGSLDKKIELNQRMNETLEAMVRAIFKSWFVDFGPVHAKAEGRELKGIAADVCDQFPSAFSKTRIGSTPHGWAVGPIISRARLLSGGTPKTARDDYWDGDILWASAKDVSQSRDTVLVTTERTITSRGLSESATQLIPAWCTVVVARGATTGRMALLGREMAMNQTCYALQSTIEAPLALYCQLRESIPDLVHAAHGSVFDTITTSTFANSLVVLPPESLVLAFEDRVRPLFQLMLSNIKECRTLAAMRDELLPKLMSGQI